MLLVSTLFSLIAAEFAYRILRLKVHALNPRAGNFRVASDIIYRFSEEFGYEYIPNKEALAVDFKNGCPRSIHRLRINPEGNIGLGARGWRPSDLKVLVVGDSFTANPSYGGITWTDYLPRFMDAGARSVAVLNLGRDGYNIPRMLHLASARMGKKPDLIIIAIITADLRRAASWRYVRKTGTGYRLLNSTSLTDEAQEADALILDRAISEKWFSAQKLDCGRGDPTTKKIMRTYDSLSRGRKHPLYSFSHSYLLDRLSTGDPFYSVKPMKGLYSYEGYPGFREDVAALQNSKTPIVLVHLPDSYEIEAGRYRMSRQERSLLDSLKPVGEYIDIVSGMQRDASGMFIPDDRHPSRRGSEIYAKAIAAGLMKRLRHTGRF